MVRALGYSLDDFDPADPGRLCRGRERWIDPLPLAEGETPTGALHRLVVSGAAFTDESASDAQRGLRFSGLNAGEIISAIFPGRFVVALAEDSNPRELPEGVFDDEVYALTRLNGPLRVWKARWKLHCPDAATMERAVDAGADVFAILGQRGGRSAARATPEPMSEALDEALFLLVGFRQDGLPSRRFQASALPSALEYAHAIVLVHQDKHNYSLGIYANERLNPREALERLARARGALPVPFAIPPMLARWDRALWELRQGWDERAMGEFPVPPAVEPGRPTRWAGRREAAEE